ncbi:hypothetical protein RC1_3960 [Rhodospirillum centenum SW]|uniref:Uncharacterized protein n=1 Tax=Rhodospirillum centenum (strain ATCC 51521 / SW) TaxID=414684 RepID=B6IYC8_RHOCS|nr:hypothetical protein RC1_3960 [Rhodospirillum centenum SW]
MVDTMITADQMRRHGGNGGIRMGKSSAARQGRLSCLGAANTATGTMAASRATAITGRAAP